MSNMTTLDALPSALEIQSDGKYQYFQPLTDDEYEALKVDIARRGIQTPIEIDKKGSIIDGHHRYQIAQDLGIPNDEVPVIVRDDLKTEAQRTEFAIKSNVLRRRHVGPITWAKCALELMKVRGIDRSLNHNGSTDSKAMVRSVMSELGVNERTGRRYIKIHRDLENNQAIAEQVDLGKMTVAKAMQIIREKSPKKKTIPTDPQEAQDEYEKFFQKIMNYTRKIASEYEDGKLPYFFKPESGRMLKENFLVIGLGKDPEESITPEQQAKLDKLKKMAEKKMQDTANKSNKKPPKS